MDKFLTFTVTGVSVAAVYAIAACGLVVTYTTSGIFNFAHGAVGMMAAFTYWQFHTAWGWDTTWSLIMVVFVVAPLFGAVIERVVMRGLQGASEAVKVVVTVSLLLALLGLGNVLWPSGVGRFNQEFFAGSTVRIGGVNVSYHRLIILGTAAAVAVLLRVLLYRTRAGIAMRAVVDDRALVQLNGGRPYRSAMIAWAIGSALAAISGIFVSPAFGLKQLDLTLLVVNAFAAAVVGRLRSLPMAFVGAMILGLTEAYATGYLAGGRVIWGFELDNIRFAISPLLLFTMMIVQPQARLRAGGIQRVREHWPVPSMRAGVVGSLAVVVVTLGITELVNADTDLISATPAFFFALVALSLVPLTGWSGQVSLAQLSFAGIGGVVMASVGADATLLGIVLAVVVSAVVGALVALPALRLTGIYLALGTAAFALVMSRVILNQPKIMPGGTRQVPPLDLGFTVIDTNQKQVMLLAVAIGAVGIGLVALRRSAFGRRLSAMKDSPVACATLGLDLTRTKIQVFALSAAIAGLGGALWSRTIQTSNFELVESMSLTMLAVVGGIGAVSGAIFGGFLFGGFATIFPTVFATNVIGIFSYLQIKVTDLTQILPGFAGISLGRNPNGAISQIAEAYGAVSRSRVAISAAVGVPALIWFLAWTDVIGNWTFIGGILVFTLGVLPLIPLMGSDSRGVAGGVVGSVGVICAIVIDWDTVFTSNGMRMLIQVLLAVLVARAVETTVGAELRPDPDPSPDLRGLDRAFTRSEIAEAERALGLRDEDFRVPA